MDNIIKTLDNGWKIEAEHDGEKVSSLPRVKMRDSITALLALAEDTGCT